MRRILGVAITVLLVGHSFAQGTEATLKAHCASEWPGDFSMQAYCEGNQRQAVAELGQLSATNGQIPEAAFKTALAGCVRDWSGDYAMQAYCLKNQIAGYNATARGPASPLVLLTPQETATIKAHCNSEWPGDFSMQSYCHEQQADGVAFLRNRPATISDSLWSSAIRSCAVTWSADYQMQAYCVRQSFN